MGPGWRQADRLAALLSTSEPTAPGSPERPAVVMLKAEGVDVVAGGDVDADPFAPPHAPGCHGPQVTIWADPARGAYVKLVTVDGVLTGFIAVGMPRTGAELTLLFERGSELPADRSSLLRLDAPDVGMPSAGDPFAADATVCWCNGVSAGAIREAAAAGEPTIACVKASTRAGTGCGGCVGRITELLARETVPA